MQTIQPTTLKVGHFQSIQLDDASVTVHDDLHGSHVITEPALVELLKSPALARLASVHQHGINGLLGVTPAVTRFEHSVGAFLIVRKAGAALDEQIAALLHDISHTVLSHVMDWALSQPGDSFHETHKARYIDMTQLPHILAKHGFADLKPLEEHLYPLVEFPAPRLCADRLDYAVRDSVAFEKLPLQDARDILASIRSYPAAESPDRFLVSHDPALALQLSRAYLASDRDVWSNPAHVDVSNKIGQLIGDLVRSGKIAESILWTVSDREFWQILHDAADAQGRELIKEVESKKLPPEDGLGLPVAAKVRTLDPHVYDTVQRRPVPLTEINNDWAEELQAYIASRQALRVREE
ncbi:hypothetical protein B0I35DRAFT_438005 [Stachybotrys elegans]|uniref:HD/PDEase domain-containing protein n=1 Tax=Stachybotrys elegans TaxID=80388 RepID=A0A8K0SQL0_9HYPO|nr:hypothetical protein B0I35DRAFT_438005 [Stachybotrys elegans]